MSKRKAGASVSTDENSGPCSRDLLRIYLRDRNMKDLKKDLLRTLKTRDDAVLDNLLGSLEAAGLDFTSARAVFTLPKSLHCVRCHKTYDPRKNANKSCTTEHDDDPECWKQKSSRGTYMYQYNCCGRTVAGDDETPDFEGNCFVGKHTDNPGEVKFGSNNVITCAESKACNFEGGEASGSSGESEASDSDVEVLEVPTWRREMRAMKKQRSF